MCNTIFFLISGGLKRQSVPLFNVVTWQRAQIRSIVEWLNGFLPYHESVDFDDLDFKCKLHFKRKLFWGIAVQDWFVASTKQSQ